MDNKKLFLVFIVVFLLIGSLSVFSITLTRDATELVIVPVTVRGEVCEWNLESSSCVGPNQEIVFGHALVYPVRDPPLSEHVDMEIFVFENDVYRATGAATRNLGSTYTEEQALELIDSETGRLPEEAHNIIGLYGALSKVNPEGNEVTGVGTYDITYSGHGGIGRYEYDIDEAANAFNRDLERQIEELGISTKDEYIAAGLPPFREAYTLVRDPFEDLVTGSYSDLILTLNGVSYKLQSIVTSVEDLRWEPE